MMNKRLEEIVREVFKLDNKIIEETWSSDDIPEWDSLGHLNLLLAIEKEFNIKFEIEEMFQIQRIGDIDETLGKKIGVHKEG